MYTATFYSFRGGVGRTTALVNVAVDLALRPRKVLLVDFDLEAPGMPNFPLLRQEDTPNRGLVEYIGDYLKNGRAPDLEDYIYRATVGADNCGELWVMPAGRGDDEYWHLLHQLNWKELYEMKDGYVLFEDLKYQWQRALQLDYVLVDARAGISERLAICTRQLPDAVVMLFAPDARREAGAADQAGFQRVLADIVAESLQSSPPRIDVLAVATRVPELNGESLDVPKPVEINCLRESGGETFVLNLAATIPDTPNAPELHLERQMVVGARSDKRLLREYRRLGDALIRSNAGQDPEGARTVRDALQSGQKSQFASPSLRECPVNRGPQDASRALLGNDEEIGLEQRLILALKKYLTREQFFALFEQLEGRALVHHENGELTPGAKALLEAIAKGSTHLVRDTGLDGLEVLSLLAGFYRCGYIAWELRDAPTPLKRALRQEPGGDAEFDNDLVDLVERGLVVAYYNEQHQLIFALTPAGYAYIEANPGLFGPDACNAAISRLSEAEKRHLVKKFGSTGEVPQGTAPTAQPKQSRSRQGKKRRRSG